jgi:UPF0716 protein FxsA
MRVLLVLALLAAAEITVLVLVGQQIGFLGLVGVLILSAIVGGWALKREGRRSRSALVEAVRHGRPAEAEVADGMFVALAGLLLVIPGLITTAAALVLLLPPVRRVFARRMAAGAVRAGSARRGPSITVVGVPGSMYQEDQQDQQRDARPFAGRIIEAPAPRTTDTPDAPPGR